MTLSSLGSRASVVCRCAVGVLALVLVLGVPATTPAPARAARTDVVLVIHGGAGTIRKADMTPEKEAAVRGALTQALKAGYAILIDGGDAVDAVQAAIRVMEDSPLFNAGRGAVFSSAGRNECDAAIMDGGTHNAGAVASVVGIKNPILAARAVMDKSRHVMLVGEGAVTFAKQQGLELADSTYFFTQRRWDALQRARAEERKKKGEKHSRLDAPPAPLAPAGAAADRPDDGHFGTVGAVALDVNGDIAAATSTGGLTNKRWGRVGDSPIIGAGTYADSSTCGVSGTGIGEYYMRGVLAYDVSARMRYAHESLHDAVHDIIHGTLVKMAGDGSGGMIALDKDGHVEMEFNTEGMYRGVIRADGMAHTFMYRGEKGGGEGE